MRAGGVPLRPRLIDRLDDRGRIDARADRGLEPPQPGLSVGELSSRGVELVEEPEERPYGIDSGVRDPSGNSIGLTQVRALAVT